MEWSYETSEKSTASLSVSNASATILISDWSRNCVAPAEVHIYMTLRQLRHDRGYYVRSEIYVVLVIIKSRRILYKIEDTPGFEGSSLLIGVSTNGIGTVYKTQSCYTSNITGH